MLYKILFIFPINIKLFNHITVDHFIFAWWNFSENRNWHYFAKWWICDQRLSRIYDSSVKPEVGLILILAVLDWKHFVYSDLFPLYIYMFWSYIYSFNFVIIMKLLKSLIRFIKAWYHYINKSWKSFTKYCENKPA